MYTEMMLMNVGNRTWFLTNNRMSWWDKVDAYIITPPRSEGYLGRFTPVMGSIIASGHAILIQEGEI